MPPTTTQTVAIPRTELAERGVEVREVQELDWGSFVSDPDGNSWAVQQLPARD